MGRVEMYIDVFELCIIHSFVRTKKKHLSAPSGSVRGTSWFELDDFLCWIEFVAYWRSLLMRCYCAALSLPPFSLVFSLRWLLQAYCEVVFVINFSHLRKASLTLLFCLKAASFILVFFLLCKALLALLFCLTAAPFYIVFSLLCKASHALLFCLSVATYLLKFDSLRNASLALLFC